MHWELISAGAIFLTFAVPATYIRHLWAKSKRKRSWVDCRLEESGIDPERLIEAKPARFKFLWGRAQ